MKLIFWHFLILSCLLPACTEKYEEVPTLTTAEITRINLTFAQSGGNITDVGSGAVTSRSIYWSDMPDPTIDDHKTSDGSGEGSFLSYIVGLNSATTYYLRAYAINSAGTGYGQQIQFTTLVDYTGQTGTVTDIDGNTYTTIGIGGQIWMAENLKTTRLNNGTPIARVTNWAAWGSFTEPHYCYYNNDSATYCAVYGGLYNWATVSTENMCPTKWHVPSIWEWTTLTDYLSGTGVAGGKLKESGTTHWSSPNTGATNESGFTALPGGYRSSNGQVYSGIGNVGFWWSATEYDAADAYNRGLVFNSSEVGSGEIWMKGMDILFAV